MLGDCRTCRSESRHTDTIRPPAESRRPTATLSRSLQNRVIESRDSRMDKETSPPSRGASRAASRARPAGREPVRRSAGGGSAPSQEDGSDQIGINPCNSRCFLSNTYHNVKYACTKGQSDFHIFKCLELQYSKAQGI